MLEKVILLIMAAVVLVAGCVSPTVTPTETMTTATTGVPGYWIGTTHFHA